MDHPKTKKPVVVIIGCGAAGLGAATTLKQHCDLIILEARNRIGGRTYTIKCGEKHIPVDLGASWLEGVGRNKQGIMNPMATQARKLWKDRRQFGLGQKNGGMQRAKFWEEKDGVPKKKEESMIKRYRVIEKEMNNLIKKMSEGDENKSLEDVRLLAMKKLRYSATDEEEKCCTTHFLLSGIEQYYGGTHAQMSALWFDAAEEDCYQGREMWVQDGYGTLVESFANIEKDGEEDIMSKVCLNHVVTKIKYNGKQNVVVSAQDTTADGDGEVEFRCDAVVVALPIGVLQHGSVEFEPPLPERKEAAIGGLGSALMNKIIMVFEERFWGDKLGGWTYGSRTRGKFRFWIAPEKDEPVLMCILAPGYAEASEDLTDEELEGEAVSVLQDCFPGSSIHVTHFYRSQWWKDPFSRGTWTYIPAGSHPDVIDTLAEPIDDCLFFAGECTSRSNFSTVHGAFDSGKRAGQEILAQF